MTLLICTTRLHIHKYYANILENKFYHYGSYSIKGSLRRTTGAFIPSDREYECESDAFFVTPKTYFGHCEVKWGQRVQVVFG